MTLIVAILLGAVAFGLLKRDRAKWYEYIAVFVIYIFVVIGLMLI